MLVSVANASENVGAAAPMSTGSSIMSLLPMVLIFAIFYFFLIRPQVKKQKIVDSMISNLKKGDKVIAASGLQGVVAKIEGDILYLEIAENVRIKAAKSSVTELLSKVDKPVVKEEAVDNKVEKPKAAPKPKKAKNNG